MPQTPTHRPGRGAARVRAAFAVLALSAPALALGAIASAQSGPPPSGDDDVAARAFDTTLTWGELDPVLVLRRAMSQDGREILKHMAESLVLEKLAKERGIRVSDAAVEARFKELDRQVKASGDKLGIEGMMRKARLAPDEFRNFLRLSIVQETLTRHALGIPEKVEVKGDQQELWMQEALNAREFVQLLPPWKDAVVAHGSDFEIRLPEFLGVLRRRLPESDLREDCYQMLLLKRIQARMPDLAPERLDRYVDEEIQRRRAETALDPRYKGVPYDKLLAAQGILVDRLTEDPSVRVAALARAWVDRAYAPDALRKAYENERAHYDGLYGAAIDTWMLFLRGAQFKNALNPRSFKEAETELERLKGTIHSLDEFKRLAKERSEEAGTRESGGALGFVGPLTERLPEEIRARVAKTLATEPEVVPASATPGASAPQLSGPLRVANGCVLLWLGERRPAPTWEAMAAQVHRELRKKFVDEVLPRASLVTTFEVP